MPITGRMLALKMGTIENAQQASAHLQTSEYDDDEITQFDGVLGERGRPNPRDEDEQNEEEEATVMEYEFDGIKPSSKVVARDAFIAVEAPVQSRELWRREHLYRMVIDQFAVGHNPRYDPDGPGKTRGHIFVWDVSRAMNCEIPKFIGGREQTAGLMCDWIRAEGPSRGWRKVKPEEALEAANAGMMVVVIPREFRQKMMGIARPGELNADGNPFISAAGVQRGNGLTVEAALGVKVADFYVHE